VFIIFCAKGIINVAITPTTFQQIDGAGFSSNFLFSIMLLIFLPLAHIKRRKRIFVVIAIIFSLASYISWFSSTSWWAEYDISTAEQKIIAVLL
jgi:membrane-anchored protein YejM (alkaline phosphatase superfamily)